MKLPSFLKKLLGRNGRSPAQEQSAPTVASSTGRERSESPESNDDPIDSDLETMLAAPRFLADPVFPKDTYLEVFATEIFKQILAKSDLGELVEKIEPMRINRQMASLRANSYCLWAIDLDQLNDHGVIGKDEFISRVSQPILRPPSGMNIPVAHQHVLMKGVAEIQIEDQPGVPGQYQICKLKVIGWYVAALVTLRE